MKLSKIINLVCFALLIAACGTEKIDRRALVERNSPVLEAFDSLSSLSVGNGNFCFTVDATGLQTFPETYKNGVPLGTQSSWGWHSFPNVNAYRHEETLENYPYHNNQELYAVQFKEGRRKEAADYFRENPHRLHLGYVGLEFSDSQNQENFANIVQTLDLWKGVINSSFDYEGTPVSVKTAVNPDEDIVAVQIKSELAAAGKMKINLRFPYPTGKHSDDASDFSVPEKHKSEIVYSTENEYIIKRTHDSAVYFVKINFTGKAELTEKEQHYFLLSPDSEDFTFTVEFSKEKGGKRNVAEQTFSGAANYWQNFWKSGAAVDFSKCSDERAKELERRVVLSQYLLAINSSGAYPPQETGLTYNSWFGRPHLEMHWWHSAWAPLWNRAYLLERSMDWYGTAVPAARQIAERQGFTGIRWMKMTDPWAGEAPSNVGSFLIWQQPHYIYFSEMLYRNSPTAETLHKYYDLVMQTAEFMSSFATYDETAGRYVLKGIIAAQETTRASETINPPLELSYWHFALNLAQEWRERMGERRNTHWDEVIAKLSPLAHNADGLYLAFENAADSYLDERYFSDHPAVLGALGVLPMNSLIHEDYMKNTLNWIFQNWKWETTWGWDFPMMAMCATRLGEPETAVDALLMDVRTNTYLVSGHNYQNDRLRIYLPGNGGLLSAVALMCAGWDGCTVKNPGFPKNGKWDVRWEGLKPLR
jgi:hypothetical protein